MEDIIYGLIDHEDGHLLSDLREELRVHHRGLCRNFSEDFTKEAFERYTARFLEKARRGDSMTHAAIDAATDAYIGYCTSTIDKDKTGEILSLFVTSKYRGRGIGEALVQKALDWLGSRSVEAIELVILAENEEVAAFYERFDFRPRRILMKQIRRADA